MQGKGAVMQLRWITGAIYLMIGVPLLVINLTERPMIGLGPGPMTLMVGIAAVALGLFRLATAWTISRKRNPPPPPVRRRRVEGASLEYNPEFDFTKPGPQTIPTDENNPKA
jgi:hypothetical protein